MKAPTQKFRKGGVNVTTIDEHGSYGQIVADLAFAQVQSLRVARLPALHMDLGPQPGLVRRRTAPDGSNAFTALRSDHAAGTCMNNAASSAAQHILLRSPPSK